jgi:hypothetical protein
VIKIPSGLPPEMWEVDLGLEDKILESEAEGVRQNNPDDDLVTGSSAPKMMDPQARWELPLLVGHLRL